jgi:hypothetical protein
MPHPKKTANAEKQRKFRERQKAAGKKLVRGYITPKAMDNYKELSEKTGWTDSEMLSNALRITFAAYKNGQIPLLNKWLLEQDQKQQRNDELAKKKALKSASSDHSN